MQLYFRKTKDVLSEIMHATCKNDSMLYNSYYYDKSKIHSQSLSDSHWEGGVPFLLVSGELFCYATGLLLDRDCALPEHSVY